MRNPTFLDNDKGSIFETTQTLQMEGGLLGMEFESNEECVFVVRQYHIRYSLDYSVYKYDSKLYIIKCVNK